MALTRCPTAVLSAGAEVNPHGSSFGDGLEGLNQGSTPLHLAAYLAREDVATLMDLREALATVVTAEDETPLRGALVALWASDLPPTTMLHVRRIQTGNVAGLGEGKRVSCEEPE